MRKTYRITPRARDDLVSIARYTELKWGKQQRNKYLRQLQARFAWLAKNPMLGKHRPEIVEGYYCYPQGEHVVFYIIQEHTIAIIGIPHQQMDIDSQAKRVDALIVTSVGGPCRGDLNAGPGARHWALGPTIKPRRAIMSYQSFENLEVWKRASRIAVTVYQQFKECRDYGLKDQVTRAAVSIASNIAEGYERNTKREFIRFLNIAKGSAAELRTQIYIATRIGVINNTDSLQLVSELKEISAMLHGLIKAKQSQTLNPEP